MDRVRLLAIIRRVTHESEAENRRVTHESEAENRLPLYFPARCHAILLAHNWNGLAQTSDVHFVELSSE